MSSNLIINNFYLYTKRIAIQLASKQFSKRYLLLLTILSSSLFGLSWCSSWFGGFLCVAIVPILAMMKPPTIAATKKRSCLFAVVATLFLWNTLTLWWVYNATFEGFLFVACCNAVLLTLPWFFYYYMRKWGGLYIGYLGLITSWLTLEHMHLSWELWELTFPWLNLGNGLAALPQWIQWYEYTGILGGSLWILITNILLYHLLFEKARPALLKGLDLLQNPICDEQFLGEAKSRTAEYSGVFEEHRQASTPKWPLEIGFAGGLLLGWLMLPITISYICYYTYTEKGTAVEAVVVQPNFDSYTEKYPHSPHFVPYRRQIDWLLTLSKQELTPSTSLVIWPESAIEGWVEEASVHDYPLMQPIFQFLETYASLNLITGASSRCIYGPTKATQTAQVSNGTYFDEFNSVFHLKTGQQTDIYHKVKILPGGECIPYINLLPEKASAWLRKQFVDIGCIEPRFGKGNGAKVFAVDDQIKVAPIICYELLYGAFAGSSVQQGANLFAIATNDGWWGATPIYHQFFQYTRLLAIAHRRSVMRAANTGISGFINQRGEVIAATNRLEAAAMRAIVYTNNQMTFYSLYGDYIGHIASWTCLLLCCIISIRRLRKKTITTTI